jgi:hypothetical protein
MDQHLQLCWTGTCFAPAYFQIFSLCYLTSLLTVMVVVISLAMSVLGWMTPARGGWREYSTLQKCEAVSTTIPAICRIRFHGLCIGWLTSYRMPVEKLMVIQSVTEFASFYGVWIFITISIIGLFSMPDESSPCHHVLCYLSTGYFKCFPSSLPTKVWYAFVM